MKIQATCPNCQGTLEGGKELAEKTVKCPNCSADVKFPVAVNSLKFVIAIVAVLAEVIVFAIIVAFLGFRHIPIIPGLVLVFVMGVTFAAITKRDFFIKL